MGYVGASLGCSGNDGEKMPVNKVTFTHDQVELFQKCFKEGFTGMSCSAVDDDYVVSSIAAMFSLDTPETPVNINPYQTTSEKVPNKMMRCWTRM